jgi:hypothetical protein
VNTTYTVSGQDSIGCIASKTVNIKVNALPVISVSPASQTLCTGETFTLTASGAVSYSWNQGGTGSTYTNTGLFTLSHVVTGTDANNCSATTNAQVVVSKCTDINSVHGVQGVRVYPNPSTGVVSVDTDSNTEKTILVFNSMGQKVYQTSTTDTATVVDLTRFAKGIYYLNVSFDGTVSLTKLIVQ